MEVGKLPVPSRIVQEDIVGPSLGAEAIRIGIISLLLGLILVIVFMVFYYSTAGMVADLALFANIFFIFGVLASIGATLTLPGIAGLVLTMGMAVDANVIIYERIREELAKGKSMVKAIADGYSGSYSAIIDSNLTTLIIALILVNFGTCLLYTSDAADERSSVDLGGRRIIKKKNKKKQHKHTHNIHTRQHKKKHTQENNI